MTLLNGIEYIPNTQSGIETTVRRMSAVYRSLSNTDQAYLRAVAAQFQTLYDLILYFSRMRYIRNGAGQDFALSPVNIIKRGFGDCNELNFALGAVLKSAGYPVSHITAARNGSPTDQHYWISFIPPNESDWTHIDVTLTSVLGRSALDVRQSEWSRIQRWDFETGNKAMRSIGIRRGCGLGDVSDYVNIGTGLVTSYLTSRETEAQAKAATAQAKADAAKAQADSEIGRASGRERV